MIISSVRRFLKGGVTGAIIVGIVAIMLVTLFTFSPGKGGQDTGSTVYIGPSVKVGGRQVTDEEFNNTRSSIYNNMVQYYNYYPEPEDLNNRALDSLIDAKIRELSIERSSVKVTKREIEKMYTNLRSRFSTKEEFTEWLKGIPEIKTEWKLRREIRKEIKGRKFYIQLAKNLKFKVSEQALQDNLNSSKKAGDKAIVTSLSLRPELKKGETAPDKATIDKTLKKAAELHEKASKGGDLVELAKAYSADLRESQEMTRQDLYDLVGMDGVETVFAAKEGTFLKPFNNASGVAVVKVEKIVLYKPDAAERKEINENYLLKQFLGSQQFTEWLQNQRKKFVINIQDPALRAYQLKMEKNWEKAADFYEKAVRQGKNRNKMDLYSHACQAMLEAQRWDKAVWLTRIMSRRWPDEMDVYIKMARAYYGKNKSKPDKLVGEALEKAKKLAGKDVTNLQKLMEVSRDFKMEKYMKKIEAEIVKIEKKRQSEVGQSGTESGENSQWQK
ncbi:MAG: SurA N-terminal domain-containing protein [Bacillota bacterium]